MSTYFIRREGCSHRTLFPGVEAYITAGDKLMLSLVELEPHAVVEMHSHPHEQLGMLLDGELIFTIGDEQQQLKPGDMWRIPGGVAHRVVAGSSKARALDVFHPIREDYMQ
jgi:quercetin dioxygenase-like cupin family protein